MMHILSLYLLTASSALRLDTAFWAQDHGKPKTQKVQTTKKVQTDDDTDQACRGQHGKQFMSMAGSMHSHLKIEKADEYPGFNPALAELPDDMKKNLHPEAFYVLATKLSHNQCKMFCYTKEKTKWSLWKTERQDYASAISILNKDLKKVLGPVTIIGGEDMRLLNVDNIILADYHYKGANWEVRQLHLGINGGAFNAALGSISYGEMENLSPGFEGQNIGLIAKNSEIYGIFWMNETSVREARKIASPSGQEEKYFQFDQKAAPKEVHNSIHPVYIPEINQYLGAAHFSSAPWGQHGMKYASEYMQYMVLIDPSPPFRMRKRTPDFCFPSLDAAGQGKCEVIQYVSGITRNPQNPEELLISYGVNDCESLIARVPLKTVLHAMFDSNLDEGTSFARVRK